MKSIGAMINQLAALLGTRDLSDWEHKFVANIAEVTNAGRLTVILSERQLDTIEQIYSRNFGDAA